MKKTIILNHKMSLEYDYVYSYIDKLNNIETNHDIIICPSNIYLTDFINNSNWAIGAQNVSHHTEGNYTGEISSIQLKSLGLEYSIIGHYERRKQFHESDNIINKKLIACLDSNIIPILCFGADGNIDNIKESLDTLLANINNINFIVFAYEPIKTEDTETVSLINEKVDIIYDYLYEKYNTHPNIVYGGGVIKKNINTILSNDKINGIMIGKISSDADKITKIIKEIKC